MKVAICISGQLRGDPALLAPLAELARRLQATVFVSTWRSRGEKSSGRLNMHQLYLLFGPNFVFGLPSGTAFEAHANPTFPDFLPRAEALLARIHAPVSADELQAQFPGCLCDIEDEDRLALSFGQPVTDNNSLRMLYKLWRCNEMKRRFEARAGERFDLVIRTRPDISLSLDMDKVVADVDPGGGTLIVDEWVGDLCGDKVAISTSRDADIYASLFGTAVLDPVRPWQYIHAALAHHLQAAAIRALPFSHGRLHVQRWSGAQAPMRQLVMDLIREGAATAPAALADPQSRAVVLAALQAGSELEEGRPDQARATLQAAELSAAVHPDALGALFHVQARLPQPADDAAAASLLAWTFRGIGSGHAAAMHDPRLRDGLAELHSAALGEPDPAALLLPDAAARLLHAAERPQPLAWGAAHLRGMPEGAAALDATLAMMRTAWTLPDNRHPTADLLSRRFHASRAAQDPATAAALATRLARVLPEDWRGHDHLGHVAEQAGDPDTAARHAGTALARNPNHGGLQARLATLLLRLERPADAEPLARRAAELWPDPYPQTLHARALEQLGRVEEAMAAWRRAIALAPDNHNFKAQLLRLQESQGAQAPS